MNGRQALDRLHFHDDRILDQDVDPVRVFQAPAAVCNVDWCARLALQTPIVQFPDERRNVGGLEQSGTEGIVNGKGAADGG